MRRWWLAAVGVGCAPEDDPGRCELGARMASIDDAVATIDQLPQPVRLACFLTALERPLGLVLTSDVFNTQPADGVRSPRILIRTESLTLTVAPTRQGKHLLELGERYEDGLTIKADLEFPIEGPLDPELPYERSLAAPGADETGCAVCHFHEVSVGPGRFANTELRPPDEMVVPLSVLRDEHARCDPTEDPYRCTMYAALLDHGPVRDDPFDEDVATQFGPQP